MEALSKIKSPTVLDLFCGAGGMSLGFQNAGCEILGGIDQNPHAIRTHHKNFPNCKLKLHAQDIRKVNYLDLPIKPKEIDILIGGPPCQVFSLVGRVKIKSLKNRDIETDERNFLYKTFVDYLNHYQPLFFVIENVNTLKTNKNFYTILHDLENGFEFYNSYPQYKVFYEVLQASNYGIPQARKRLFIVGRRSDCNFEFKWPEFDSNLLVSVGDAIEDLPELKPFCLPLTRKISGPKQIDYEQLYRCLPTSDYQYLMRCKKKETEGVMNHLCRAHNEKDLEIFAMMKQGDKYKDLPDSVKRYRSDIFEDKYKRLRWDQPSWTLTAHMQRDCLAYIHPTQNRSISVREAARLQSFPDHFVFDAPMTRMFELVGNSVPPLLAEAIARPIVEQIQAYYANMERL